MKFLNLFLSFVLIHLCVCNLEQPSYKIIKKLNKNIEIRKYSDSKWICSKVDNYTNAENKQLFLKLFYFINGKNDQNKSIPMTAPVVSYFDKLDTKTMCFFIPVKFQNNIPNPNYDLFIMNSSESTVATIKFGGYANYNDFLDHKEKLIKKLNLDSIYYDTNATITAGYDAPFKFYDRVNEVWLKKF